MNFYELSDKGNSFVDHDFGNDWEQINCPVDDGHQGPGERITTLILRFISSKPVDLSWTMLSDIVISEKALRVIKDAKFTGYEIKPTIINPTKRKFFMEHGYPKLYEFIVTGSGGVSHPDSGITLKYKCDACGLIRYTPPKTGIIVDENNWDGSDFFTIVEHPKYFLVTEKVKEVFEKNKLTNIIFTPSQLVRWEDPLKGFKG